MHCKFIVFRLLNAVYIIQKQYVHVARIPYAVLNSVFYRYNTYRGKMSGGKKTYELGTWLISTAM